MKHPTTVQKPTMPERSNAQIIGAVANLINLIRSYDTQIKALAISPELLSGNPGAAAS